MILLHRDEDEMIFFDIDKFKIVLTFESTPIDIMIFDLEEIS